MAKLLYITNMSLDGYIADESGAFDFGNPQDIHPLVVELLQPVGMYLYGRRMYELMAFWDSPAETYPLEYRAFAQVWQKPGKIVFSRTLKEPATRSTRIERSFDPDAIRKLKDESKHDITIGGAELASLALDAGLVDDCHLLVHPVLFGGGKPAFRSGLRPSLELLAATRSGTSIVHAHYRVITHP